MKQPISATETGQRRRLHRDRSGVAAIEFALLIPVLIFILIGILEFISAALAYQKATEATRRGARIALINPIIPALSGVASGATITCGGNSISCSGASTDNPATFTALLTSMQEIMPDLVGDNVLVTYVNFAVGGGGITGTVTPVITVSLINYDHPLLVISAFPGFPSVISFPNFSTSRLASTVPAP